MEVSYSDAGAGAAAALAAGEARRALGRDQERLGAGPGPRSPAPSSSGRPKPSSAARRSASIVSCGKRGERLGDLQRARRDASRRHDLGEHAHRSASSASMMRPVRIRSSARPMPTIRGRRCVPPSISGTPQRRSGKPSVEPSVAIRRSHHSASSSPPARHQPQIAAIVGLDGVSRVKPNGPSGAVEPRGEALDRLEVGARAEGDAAGAGDDEHARVVVGLEGRKRLQQLVGRRPVDRVAALLAVDGQDGGADALIGRSSGRPARLLSWPLHPSL